MPSPANERNPEKWMLLMFPIVTLSFFVLAVVGYYMLPKLVQMVLPGGLS